MQTLRKLKCVHVELLCDTLVSVGGDFAQNLLVVRRGSRHLQLLTRPRHHRQSSLCHR